MTGGRHLNLATVILTITILLSPTVAAGLIVVAPLNGVVSEVQPPVVLEQPADTSVNATLGPNQTSANITVNVSSGYVISLYSRAAVYWNDFNTSDPIASGDFTPLNNDTCTWVWDSTDGYLVGYDNGTSAYYGGECILMLNRYIPVSQPIYIDVDFEWADTGVLSSYGSDYYATYADIALLNSTLTPADEVFYTIGNYIFYYYSYFSGFSRRIGSGATVYYYNGTGWNLLNTSNTLFYTGTWYDLLGERNNTNGSISEYYGSTQLVSATNTSLTVDRIGLAMYVASLFGNVQPYEVVYYDSLVVTVGRPPYYVQIVGLQAGDEVYIIDSSGNIVAQARASGNSVSIDFWNIKMLRNATIEVYDSSGNLIAENLFNWIVEGDIYAVTPAYLGSIYNILNFASNDSVNTYIVGMVLNGTPTISGGTVNQLAIWVETSGNTSNTIYIENNTVISTTTDGLYLYPLYPGQVYLYWNATLGTSVEMRLWFVYQINGTIVVYPVNLTIIS